MILYSIFDEKYCPNYKERCDFLIRNGIGLWDVLQNANRKGSSDGSITNEEPNDIPFILKKHPNIKVIIFNGSKAEAYCNKYYKNLYNSIKTIRLSSTSNTPGKYVKPLVDKINEWEMAVKSVIN